MRRSAGRLSAGLAASLLIATARRTTAGDPTTGGPTTDRPSPERAPGTADGRRAQQTLNGQAERQCRAGFTRSAGHHPASQTGRAAPRLPWRHRALRAA